MGQLREGGGRRAGKLQTKKKKLKKNQRIYTKEKCDLPWGFIETCVFYSGYLARARARAPKVGPGAPRKRGGSGASPPAFAKGVSAGVCPRVFARVCVFMFWFILGVHSKKWLKVG